MSHRRARTPRPAWLALGALLFAACHLVAGLEEGELRPGTGGSQPSTGGAGGDGQGGETTSSSGGSGGAASTGGGGATSTGGGGAGGSTGVGGSVEGMTNIPGETFMMGCNEAVDSDCSSDEHPYHEVTLTGYRIDTFEVTRGDYFECVQDGACTEPSCDWDPSGSNLQDHPVTCVTWNDADTYCSWASKRLPTEAEWEYAARGTTGNRYPWGNSFNANCNFANANLCKLDTAPVGTHPTGTSPLGVLDMAGNVAEWVNDYYQADYYETSPSTDPPGPSSGGTKVLRGGSWDSPVVDFRTSARDAQIVSFADNKTGFRCAM